MKKYRMKSKVICFFLLFIVCVAYSQKNEPRKILNGQAISDSLLVENIMVLNKSSNIKAITDEIGNFTIYARAGDTLFFSGLAFRDARLILSKGHFDEPKLIVKLEVDVNVLDEVIVTPLTGNLAADSKKVKIKDYNGGYDSSGLLDPNDIRNYQFKEPNSALPQTESNLAGVDFKRLYRLFVKKKHKNNNESEYVAPAPFTEIVKQRFTHYFFTETLQIPHDEISLFLAYCEAGEGSTALLHPEKKLELIDYLVLKSAEYLKKDK